MEPDMAKPDTRPYSRYGLEAVELLGLLIHDARTARGLTVAEAAERAGISRGLVHRIENGEMGCSIGAVFELAAIVGVPLFAAEPSTLTQHLATAHSKLTLLPKRVRKSTTAVKNDF
jgi:transcriptional regulator with XRE-family HTH domain